MMWTRITAWTACGDVLGALAIVAILAGQRPITSSSVAITHATTNRVITDGDYAYIYRNLHDLKRGSVLVAEGTVTGVQKTVASDPAFGKAPTVYLIFSIERTLKGIHHASVTVAQIAGPNLTNEDDPPLVVGERAVLFLYTGDGSFYTILDGGIGHFTINQNGTVTQRIPFPAASSAEATANALRAANPPRVTEAQFIAQVLAA